MNSIRRFLQFLRPFRAGVVANIIFNALSNLFGLFSLLMIIPFLEILFQPVSSVAATQPDFALTVDWVKGSFNYLLDHLMREQGKEAALLFVCAIILGTSLLKNAFRYLALYFLAPVRTGVVRSLREQMHTKLLDLPLSYYTEKRKGDLLTRASSDVLEIEHSVLSIIETFFKEPIAILMNLIVLLVLSPVLTLIVVLTLPIAVFVIGRIGRSLKHVAKRGQGKLSDIVSQIEETIGGLRIIKAFASEDSRKERFGELNLEHYTLNTKVHRRSYLGSPLMEVLSTLIVVAILYIGSNMVLGGNSLPAQDFIAYLAIFSMMINPAKAFSTAWYRSQKGMASVERIDNLLEEDLKVTEAPDAKPIQAFSDRIEYQNVTFAYDTLPVLRDASVAIEKGSITALVGQSGSGKSTFVDLLPRFHDVSSGAIEIDGVPISELKLADLRGLLGIVSQEPILFNDTIFNNIAFGRADASQDAVISAAKAANAHSFISAQENGYQTVIGDRGMKLSGGERQRITIARAVLKNPPILILDEATSSLDSESERLVQEAMAKLMTNRTSIVIAHRLSTIQHADQIIVLHEGQIVERGNHEALMAKRGAYHRLVELQAF